MLLWAVYLLALAVSGQGVHADDPVISDEARLHTDLFKNYDWERRPVKDHTKTVTVQLGMRLKYLTVDDISDTITVHCWMVMLWSDEYLSWNPADFGGIKYIQIESEKMWQPELYLYNADITSQGSIARFTSSCMVWFEGEVHCVPHVSHTALCAPDPRRWPYDTQNCTLRFGSWMNTGEQINFTLFREPVTQRDFQENREWELKSVDTVKHHGKYKGLNGTYPSINYSFILKRRSATHAAIVLIPAISLAVLTTTCGLLKPGALRLGVATSSLMIQIVYLIEISWYVPSHGDYPAYIILFFRDSVLITTVAILLSMAMMTLTQLTRPPPRFVAVVVTIAKSGPAKFVSFGEFDPNYMSPIVAEEGENSSRVQQERTANLEWQKFASVFNNMFFITIAIVYILLIFIYILS